MKKKILSFILTGAMLLSALPATIFASADVHDHDHDHDVATIAENGCPGGTSENHNLISCTNNSFVKHVEGKANDCTDPSYDIYQCNVCHKYFVDNFKASSHDFETVSKRQEPTCQQEGRKERRECTKCGKVDGDKDGSVIPKVPHTLVGDKIPLGPGSDCTSGGYKQYCESCEQWITVSGDHDWEFTEVTKAPVCGVSDGVALYTCKYCHTTKTVVINKEDHKIKEEVLVPGNCTTDRIVKETCDYCGATQTVNKGKQHQWLENGLSRDSDCTTWGYTTRICKICGAYDEMKPIKPKGHTEKPEDTGRDNYQPATCTKPETWTCERCGQEVTGEPALGHKDVETVEIPAICGRVSLTFKLCNRRDADGNLICDGYDVASKHTSEDGVTWEFGATYDNIIEGSYEVGKTKDPSNHLWTLKSVTKEATCTSEGIGVAYCEYCSAYDTNYVIPKKPHEKAAEKARTKVSCTTDGAEFYLCTECGAHLEEVIFEHKLDKKEVYTKEEAEKYHNVGKLEDESWDVIRNVGVNKDDKVDCSISGLYRVYCPDCDQTILIEWKRGHENDADWDDEKEVEPREQNCTNEGNTGRFECIHCGQLVGDAKKLDKLGHQYDKKVQDYKAPVCGGEAGHAEKWICSRCGIAVDPNPDRNGHDIVLNHDYETVKKAVDPTCYSVGYKELSRCKNCGAYENRDGIVLDGGEIKMTEHNMDMKYLDHTEDCTEPTLTYHYCTNPGCPFEYLDYKGEFNAASEHVWVERSGSRVPATCEDNGHVVYDCKNCKESKTETLPALGHQNKDGQKLTKDCESKDVKDRECKNCHQKINCKDGDKLIHKNATTMRVEATCEDECADVYYCPTCGYSESKTISPALGHTYERDGDPSREPVVTEATYAAPGLKVWTCGDCGATKEEVIPVLGTEDPKNLQPGLQITLSAENADVPGVGYTDSSLIAVKVSLASYLGVDVWGVSFKVNYKTDYMEFVSGKIVSTTFLSNQRVTAVTTTVDKEVVPAGYVNVNANVPATQNTKVQASEDFAILYFRVKDTTREARLETFDSPNRDLTFSTGFTVEVVKVINNNSVNITTGVTKAEVTVRPFLDWNCDGSIDIADLLDLTKMITWESEVIYDVSFDVNKNGEIDIDDMMTLLDVISETISYAQAYAQAAQ